MENKNKNTDNWRVLVEASTVGLTLVFSTFIGLGIGYLLDELFHTKPYLTILFLILGIIAGFINIFNATRGLKGRQ